MAENNNILLKRVNLSNKLEPQKLENQFVYNMMNTLVSDNNANIMVTLSFYLHFVYDLATKRLIYHPLGHEKVYLPLCKVAHTPFHIQETSM